MIPLCTFCAQIGTYKRHFDKTKLFLANYNFNKDIEVYFNNYYYEDSDEEYYDGK